MKEKGFIYRDYIKEEETVIETKTRRAAPVSVSEKTDSPARRTAAPKYKVTSIAN